MEMTSITTTASDSMPRIPGRCRRCGWGAHLLKIGRRGRALLGVGRGFRLLCDDCVADLVGSAHRDLIGMASGRAPSDDDRQAKMTTGRAADAEESRARELDRELVTV